MSDCCNTTIENSKKIVKFNCPNCSAISKSVSMATVLQNLSFPINLELTNDEFFYCSNTECDNSYFTKSGIIYKTSQIRSTVYNTQDTLCYCFDISKQQFQDALNTGTASKIKNFVITQTKLHYCSCETRNPSGQCCLAEFKKMAK